MTVVFFFQGADERAARRARGECSYDIIPSRYPKLDSEMAQMDQNVPPGYLGTFGVDCKEVWQFRTIVFNSFEYDFEHKTLHAY